MSKITKILISATTAIIALGSFASVAFAANPPLEVTWGSDPLFKVLNFVPGQSSEATITIKNNDTTTRNAYIEATSISNDDKLGDEMTIEIFKGSSAKAFPTLTFSDFLISEPILLSDIVAGGSETYRLKVTFLEDAGDSYQGKTLGFDICVGFSGGNETCSKDIVVSPEEGNINTSGGSSGGGSSSGTHHLLITKEEPPITYLNTNQTSGLAMIVWDTNIPATSQVVYKLSSDTSYTFDTNILPGLGYPRYINEDMAKVYHHSILLTGLTPGETYVYRVVSRASPPTTGYEHEFTVPTSSQSGVVLTSGPTGVSQEIGGVLGEESGNNGKAEEAVGEVAGASDTNNLAATFAVGWNNWLWILIILILLLILGLYIYREYSKSG